MISTRLLGLAALVMFGTSLGGCILEIPTPSLDVSAGRDKMPEDETGPWTYRDPTEKELLLARSDFSVEIVRVTDSRRPRSMEALSEDQLIYQYDPDDLTGGVSTQFPNLISKYLSYRQKMPKHYKVEIDIKKLVTVIKTGSFWSGHWGRYYVAMDLSVIARRPDSTVAWQHIYRMEEEQRREDYSGRGPSKERDRARMYDLIESMTRKAAENIGWDIRMRDARTWKAPAPEVIKTGVNLRPIDRAVGTAEDNTAPMQPVPVLPSLPANPADDVSATAGDTTTTTTTTTSSTTTTEGWINPDDSVSVPEGNDNGDPVDESVQPHGDTLSGPVI